MKASRADAVAVLERIQDDPEWFACEILGHDPWATPRQIMHAVARPHARVAVKACHSSGKTHTAAEIVLWWVYSGGLAITTAPSWTQVEKLLWGEVHTAYHAARFPLGGVLNQTELRLSPTCYAVGLSTDKGVRFQGFHGRVLVVLDEAPGVRPDIWEAIEGIRAGGDVRILALGNPTIASGPFYEAFSRDRAGWATFTIDGFATPNLEGVSVEALRAMSPEELEVAPRPYLTTRRWLYEKLNEWGEGSPLWAARARGQFPRQSEDSLISLAWLEAAALREVGEQPHAQWSAGLDVAGPGESETVLTVRYGIQIVAQQAWASPDPRGEVVAALRPYADRSITVFVDSIGIGYYMARHIETELARPGWLEVVDVNVGDAALDSERYANWKAELYWGLRLRVQAGDLAGLVDERTMSQLASIRYKHTARGQIMIESKEDAGRRGVPSPDRGESVMLCFARRREEAGQIFEAEVGGERTLASDYAAQVAW